MSSPRSFVWYICPRIPFRDHLPQLHATYQYPRDSGSLWSTMPMRKYCVIRRLRFVLTVRCLL